MWKGVLILSFIGRESLCLWTGASGTDAGGIAGSQNPERRFGFPRLRGIKIETGRFVWA
jgi:hypothetical protein